MMTTIRREATQRQQYPLQQKNRNNKGYPIRKRKRMLSMVLLYGVHLLSAGGYCYLMFFRFASQRGVDASLRETGNGDAALATLRNRSDLPRLPIDHDAKGITLSDRIAAKESLSEGASSRKKVPRLGNFIPPRFTTTRRGAATARPSVGGSAFNQERVPLVQLTRDILSPQRYDIRVRPVRNHSKVLRISISMSLYQIIEVNEPAQHIKMNVWMIQKWRDESLNWDPSEYDMINTTILPHNVLWIPDTYLYNSVEMAADQTERYMNIRADSLHWEGRHGSNMSFLYPAIYTVTCRLNIRYFPYDQQNCTLTIGSWTNSKSSLDYAADERVNMASFIENEEWDVMSFRIFRHEYKYACCPEPWVILEASIVLRRKPLYYVINLILPTSIITLVAITGFFTPASTADDRTEKINLGITTLLAMSILMLMVSDQMPTTSEFVPLIAWFYLSIIVIISIGTFLTSVILSIQGRRQYGRLPTIGVRYWMLWRVRNGLCVAVPPQLLLIWDELDDHPNTAHKRLRSARKQQRSEKRKNRRKKRRRSSRRSTSRSSSAYMDGGGAESADSDAIKYGGGAESADSDAIKYRKRWNGDDGRDHQIFSEATASKGECFVNIEMEMVSSKQQQHQQQQHSTAEESSPSHQPQTEALAVTKPAKATVKRVKRRSHRLHGTASPILFPSSTFAAAAPATLHRKVSARRLPILSERARVNWRRIGAAAAEHANAQRLAAAQYLTVPMIDMQSPSQSPPPPPTPASTLSTFRFAEPSARSSTTAFDTAVSAMGMLGLPPLPPASPAQPKHQDAGYVGGCATPTIVVMRSAPSPSAAGAPLSAQRMSAEVEAMRRRRQCSLEWELLATVLDRVFLIVFTFTVMAVTAGLIVTGRVAQYNYETIADEIGDRRTA